LEEKRLERLSFVCLYPRKKKNLFGPVEKESQELEREGEIKGNQKKTSLQFTLDNNKVTWEREKGV